MITNWTGRRLGVQAIAAKAGGCDDVWLATRGEIAAHVRQVLR